MSGARIIGASVIAHPGMPDFWNAVLYNAAESREQQAQRALAQYFDKQFRNKATQHFPTKRFEDVKDIIHKIDRPDIFRIPLSNNESMQYFARMCLPAEGADPEGPVYAVLRAAYTGLEKWQKFMKERAASSYTYGKYIPEVVRLAKLVLSARASSAPSLSYLANLNNSSTPSLSYLAHFGDSSALTITPTKTAEEIDRDKAFTATMIASLGALSFGSSASTTPDRTSPSKVDSGAGVYAAAPRVPAVALTLLTIGSRKVSPPSGRDNVPM